MKHEYEAVIGLEVHVELATRTKIFCSCSTAFGSEPNTQICPVCTGMPGSLPVFNKKVAEYAIAVGLALGCDINLRILFDRKNYFYPDNPQNYQISQLYEPICTNGCIPLDTTQGKKKVRIHELHMEEDAGKLIHEEQENISLVDYNRAGVPLIEIVSEPDMNTAEEVIMYLKKLRMILLYLEVSDCKLQEGSLRVDVNLSLREVGSKELGVRTEMKNLNSFKAISRAIEAEINRQTGLLQNGEKVIFETRRWDDAKGTSYSMRSKEEVRDYRYFPEPDLLPLYIEEEWIKDIQSRQPEFQTEKQRRYMAEYKLPEYDAEILTASKTLSDLFEKTAEICKKPKKVSNWLMGETMRLLNEQGMEPEEIRFSPKHLASLIELTEEGKINSTVAKQVFTQIFFEDIEPVRYVEEKGLQTVDNQEELKKIVEIVLKNNPKSVEDYRNGKEKAIGFLVGQTMKAMAGKAQPKLVEVLLKEELQKTY